MASGMASVSQSRISKQRFQAPVMSQSSGSSSTKIPGDNTKLSSINMTASGSIQTSDTGRQFDLKVFKTSLDVLDKMLGYEVNDNARELAEQIADDLNQQYRNYLDRPDSVKQVALVREMQDIFEAQSDLVKVAINS